MGSPMIFADYPDPDIIRVGDTYYMITTTMHMFPGGEILMSGDLRTWVHCTYVFDQLDGTQAQCLEGAQIYGQGMWAASLRYHQGVFHVLFVCNDTHSSYHYTACDIRGPWQRRDIEGFYHDPSILFDEDGRVYIASGNRDIMLTEMEPDLSRPKDGGVKQIIVSDRPEVPLGYEGSHLYRIGDTYYLFLIHWPAGSCRTQAVFRAQRLTGPWEGRDVLSDDMGYHHMGVAQGGIVDDQSGRWHGILFQDHGAVGRVPVLCNVTWQEGYPCFTPLDGVDNATTLLCAKESFLGTDFSPAWQWNHQPAAAAVSHTAAGLCLRAMPAEQLERARNTLTQRTFGPRFSCSILLDPRQLAEGDRAGLAALQGCFAALGVVREGGRLYLEAQQRIACGNAFKSTEPVTLRKLYAVGEEKLRLRMDFDFASMRDQVTLGVMDAQEFTPLITAHQLHYRLDHFMGCRAALYCYGAGGGTACFSDWQACVPEGEERV